MKNFLKYTLATIVGILISSFLIVLIMIAVISSLMPSEDEDNVTIKPNSVLKITLSDEVPDRGANNPFENFNFQTMKPEQNIGLNEILKNLKKAKDDENIKGIYLEVDAIPAGIASVEEIRDALLDFRTSGKFILSYSNIYTQPAYYLASVADKLYLNPQGLLELKGLRAEIMFFKGALEKLGVEPQIIRGKNNKFKSAVEPFMYDKMSDANRIQTMTYMQSIWDHMLKGIAEQRKVTTAELNEMADSMLIKNAKAAVDYHLIDGLKYQDEIIAELQQLTDKKETEEVEYVSLKKYTHVPEKKEYKGLAKDKIAVIYAEGQIIMGESSKGSIGCESLSATIREARLDTTIKCVVLRVNSPGGDALASEIIWRELILLRNTKPLIVSQSNLAASGGYYISAPAHVIVSSETTITGSIGVFGVLWNGGNFLKDKLGVTIDVAKTNAHSDIGSMFRKLTPSEYLVIQEEVQSIYNVFISHVADDRHMTTDEVDSIGQGRVWSGINAKERGLVDEIGGLSRAIEIAVEKTGLEKYRIVELPKEKNPFEEIVAELTGEAEMSLIKNHLGENYRYYQNFEKALKIKGIQARLPYEIDIY